MNILNQWCRIGLLALLFLFPASFGHAEPIMPLEEVKPGMHGIAKTVISGTKIEEFGVEVLGIMKNKGPSGDLILVRTYGDLIEKTGGIAQGMSGSPVYIDGKLVGAIGYGWSLTDHKTGMVTPIADMLKLLPKMPESNETASPAEPDAERPDPGQTATPLATPLMVSGFSERALGLLSQKLQPYQLKPYAVGDAASDVNYGKLEPGSAVGVQLVRGDVNVGALGTVTYVDGKNVLAFGHPFLKKGSVGFYMANAYVFTTMQGLENSFKLGVTGDAVGSIKEDRGAGIAGELDSFPSNIPVHLTVKDTATGKSQNAFFQVVQDEQLGPILAAAGVFNIIDKTIDRVGPGTARVSFEVAARNMPGDVFRRENMFYSPANAGEYAVGEFFEALAVLAGNQFHPVDIMDVTVKVEMAEERRTAAIVEAKAEKLSAKPGETVRIGVKIKPFRGQPVIRTVAFTIPKDQPAGPMILSVRGGGMVPLLQLLLKQQDGGEFIKLEKKKPQTFDAMLQEFEKRDRNNDIVVEIMDLDEGELAGGLDGQGGAKAKIDTVPNPAPKELKKSPKAALLAGGAVKKGDEPKSKTTLTTDYIIEGSSNVTINIVGAAEKK